MGKRKVETLSREEVEVMQVPFFKKYNDVPKCLYSKTTCEKLKMPVGKNEQPAAYVLNRMYKGYLPLYKREYL